MNMGGRFGVFQVIASCFVGSVNGFLLSWRVVTAMDKDGRQVLLSSKEEAHF
jgi:hypothetical protein